MAISLETFQRTLDTSKLQGFVKLSEDGAGVKSVGGGFFARHFGLYTKPTAEQNNEVRRAFYESVVDSFHCRGEVLDVLRHDLGIGEDGTSTSGAKLSVRDAKAILQRVKAAIDELNANAASRNNLYDQLSKDGLCQSDIGMQVRAMLNLDDAERVQEPLSQTDRDAAIAFAKDSSARLHGERLTALGLPTTAEGLANLVAPEKLQDCKAILANTGSTVEQLKGIVRAINDFAIGEEHESWSAQVDDALRQLSAEVGIDCSSMKDAILSRLEGDLRTQYNGAQDVALISKEQIRNDFSAALAKFVDAKRAMNASLASAAPNLPAAAMNYLKSALASDPEFGTPKQMQSLINGHDAAIPLLNLLYADTVTESDYLDAVATMREKTGADMVDSQESSRLCKMFLDMGKAVVEAAKGQPQPGVDRLKPLLEKHVSQLLYVQKQIKNLGGDFCCGPAAAATGVNADLMRLRSFAAHCGLSGIGGLKAAEGAERTISPLLEKQLEGYGVSRTRKNIDNGDHFDITLRSAFQEAMLKGCQSSLDRADQTDLYPDVAKSFTQPVTDYVRAGAGLKVGDVVVARANEVPDEARKAEAVAEMNGKLERFFAEDEANGMRAARIIGDLVHQGFMASVMDSIMTSGEPFAGMFHTDLSHVMDFSVQRTADGGYKIRYSGDYSYRIIANEGKMEWLDASRSRVSFELDMTLSFDAASGKPELSFDRPPAISGRLTPTGLSIDELGMLQELRDPKNETDYTKFAELSGVLRDSSVRHAVFETDDNDAAIKLLRERVIGRNDTEFLGMLGFSSSTVTQMIARLAGDESTPRLSKGLIAQLMNPATRDSAMRTLSIIVGPIAREGWIDGVPNIRPEIINLVTAAGLSTSSFAIGMSDARLAADFILRSPDPAVQRLPVDLQSTDPSVVEAAKSRVQEVAREARRAVGLRILCSHIRGFSGDNIRMIEANIPAAQYQDALRHVVAQDEFFDDGIKAFKDMLEIAKIIDAGKRQQHT